MLFRAPWQTIASPWLSRWSRTSVVFDVTSETLNTLDRHSPAIRPTSGRPSRLIPTAICLALTAPLAALPRAVHAADGDGADIDTAHDTSEEVVVVANRAPLPLSQVGSSVTVLTAAQIKDSQQVFIADLLAMTPGINYSRSGGVGTVTQLNIRGAETDQTLVLIDGVQINDPSAPGGGFDFANLLTGDTARIEILRGAHSTLYGSQAIGGVVSITTAPPASEPSAALSVEGGSHRSGLVTGSVGSAVGASTFRLAGQHFQTGGIADFDPAFGGTRLNGNHNNSVSGRYGYAFSPDWSLDLRGFYTQSRTEFDGYDTPTGAFGDDSEYGTSAQAIGYAGVNGATAGGTLKHRLDAQFTETNRHNYDPALRAPTETFYGISRNRRAEYQGTFTPDPTSQWVYGLQAERATMSTDTPAYDTGPGLVRAEAGTRSAYTEYTFHRAALTVTAGARRDRHDTFGTHTTGQAAVAWALGEGSALRASVGQGFKAPALYQLYSPYGTTTLRPETANSWDAGLTLHPLGGRLLVAATVFHRDSHDLIGFVDCSTPQPRCVTSPQGYYDNTTRAVARGAELEAAATLTSTLSVAANSTLTDNRDRSPGAATDGKELFRRPRVLANLTLIYCPSSSLTASLAARYAGATYDDPANAIRLSPYTVMDLRAAYNLTPHWLVYGRVENLADRHYETAYQYGTYRRGGYLGIEARL